MALFWSLALAASVLGWLDAAAISDAQYHDAQLAMTALSHKRLIGVDVRATLAHALADSRGGSPAERVADAAARLELAAAFLERSYGRQGVSMRVFFGFLSDAEQDAWLDRLGRGAALSLCPRCLPLKAGSGAVGSVLSAFGGNVSVSKNGLHRGFPFASFGRPIIGAVYSFGPVVGLEVIGP